MTDITKLIRTWDVVRYSLTAAHLKDRQAADYLRNSTTREEVDALLEAVRMGKESTPAYILHRMFDGFPIGDSERHAVARWLVESAKHKLGAQRETQPDTTDWPVKVL